MPEPPSTAGPAPGSRPGSGPGARPTSPLASAGPSVAVFVIAWLWLSLRPGAPVHEDTSRDLAFARDLVDGAVLHTHGAWASFVSLHQGTTFVDVLALMQRLGLGIVGIERVLTVILAASVGLAHLGFRRMLPPRGDPTLDALAPSVGALVLLAAVPMAAEMPILWQPTLLLPAIVVAHLSAWRLVRDGELVDALALAVACAFALDIHVISVVFVGLAVVAVPLASKRPLVASVSAAVLGLGTLALCSWGAVEANGAILVEQGWLVPGLAVVGLGVVVGVVARGRFAALPWPTRLRLALGVELLGLALIVAASLADFTPSLTGRYLLPLLPAVALASALATSWARTRSAAWVTAGLALLILGLSVRWLRPEPERILPIYPEWRIAEFEPVADELRARGSTWTELAVGLAGPSHAQVLGYLASQVDPGPIAPASPTAGLLIVGLEPSQWAQVEAELPPEGEGLTRVALPSMEVALLDTPARTDRSKVQLCHGGQDCVDVVLAVTSRVYQAHATAWIGSEPALDWLRQVSAEAGEDELREIQWRLPVRPGPEVVLLLTSVLPEHCAWHVVAAEGFELEAELPTHELTLPGSADGALLLSRTLDEDEWACQEHGLLPPAVIETAPEWTRLRELLAPPW